MMGIEDFLCSKNTDRMTKNSKNINDIKEIDVDDIVSAIRSSTSRMEESHDAITHNRKKKQKKAKEQVPFQKDVLNDPEDDEFTQRNSNHLTRKQKEKLRLQRKLADKKALLSQTLDGVANVPFESSSDSEQDKARTTPKTKKRANYVERRSAVLPAAPETSGWSLRDFLYFGFFGFILIFSFYMKFNEESFSETDHIRGEAESIDFYELLGISRDASIRDVKRAYRTKVLEVHPDHNPGCVDCESRFVSVVKAYETLSDPDKKKVYDETSGSYEPIRSDHSISIAAFNYNSLVEKSPYVWILQIYDDLDQRSQYFANIWDSVAGSDEYKNLKFGRINVRRDRNLLSQLPVRVKMYPAVILVSRDSMPSILPMAEQTARGIRKWISEELVDYFGLDVVRDYTLNVAGRSLNIDYRILSKFFHKWIKFEFVQGKSSNLVLNSKRILGFNLNSKFLLNLKIENLQDFNDLCKPESVYCVVSSDMTVWDNPAQEGEATVQRVQISGVPEGTVIDYEGNRIAENLQDLDWRRKVSMEKWLSEVFPRSVFSLENLKLISIIISIVSIILISFKYLNLIHFTILMLSGSIIVSLINSNIVQVLLRMVK
jgi:curved DNA-binding protein CbpA